MKLSEKCKTNLIKYLSFVVCVSGMTLPSNVSAKHFGWGFLEKGYTCEDDGACSEWGNETFCYGVNPPPIRPADCFGTLGAYGEALLWTVGQDSTYAYQSDVFTIDVVTLFETRTISAKEEFHPHYEAGFRVGILYDLPCDKWGVDVNWSYYYQKAETTAPQGSLDYFLSVDQVIGSFRSLPNVAFADITNGLSGNATITSDVRSTFRLTFNQLDADVQRSFYVGNKVLFHPYVGFRCLMIDEQFGSLQDVVVDSGTTTTVTVNQNMRQDTTGYGGHGGLRLTYLVGCGLSLFADAGTHLVWTHYNNKYLQETVSTLGGNALYLENHHSYDVMRFGSEFKAGVQWAYPYDIDGNLLYAKVGWEHHFFLDQCMEMTYLQEQAIYGVQADEQKRGTFLQENGGSLALYGVVLGLGLTF